MGQNNDLNYSIIGMTGQIIFTGQLSNSLTSIDLSSLSKGVYFLNIKNNSLNKQNNYKLVKR